LSPQPGKVDGYVRVSRVAGREGESFISPEVQRKKIQAWAELHGVEVVHWWEELDQSGRRRDRPMFQEALRRCEAGETGGIVVARLDRFARSAVDALEASSDSTRPAPASSQSRTTSTAQRQWAGSPSES
jgi:DNA invertase Pin-like site-specific DNA recombinase